MDSILIERIQRHYNGQAKGFIAAIIMEPEGSSATRWLLTFNPVFHPNSEYVILDAAKDPETGEKMVQVINLDTLSCGTLSEVRGDEAFSAWLPAVASSYLEQRIQLSRHAMGHHSDEEVPQERREIRHRMNEARKRNLDKLEALRPLLPVLPEMESLWRTTE